MSVPCSNVVALSITGAHQPHLLVKKRLIAAKAKKPKYTNLINTLETDLEVFEACSRCAPYSVMDQSFQQLQKDIRDIRCKRRVTLTVQLLIELTSSIKFMGLIKQEGSTKAVASLRPWLTDGEQGKGVNEKAPAMCQVVAM